MKKILLVLLIAMFAASLAFAGQVKGYTRSNGTYVNSYQRSNPDRTVTNNYSFKGNTNPYTGQVGTNTYKNSPSSPYYNPSTTTNTYKNPFKIR